MTGSRMAHAFLTEGACKTMSGKGREGNKEGKGTRVVTFHHIVTFVTRRAAASTSPVPTSDGVVKR